MDKNTIIGFALIALVLVGFSYWTRPSEAELAAQRKQDSIAAVMRQKPKRQPRQLAWPSRLLPCKR